MAPRARDPYEVCAHILDNTREKFDGCLFWQGAIDDKGHGYIKYQGKRVLVHRHVILYHIVRTEEQIANLSLFRVKQTCGYTLCVQPTHLEFIKTKPAKVYVPMFDWHTLYDDKIKELVS